MQIVMDPEHATEWLGCSDDCSKTRALVLSGIAVALEVGFDVRALPDPYMFIYCSLIAQRPCRDTKWLV